MNYDPMKVLISVDKWILEKVFETFSHWFQKVFSRDNFFLADCIAFIQFGFSLVFLFPTLEGGEKISMCFAATFGLFVELWLSYYIKSWHYKSNPTRVYVKNPVSFEGLAIGTRFGFMVITVAFVSKIIVELFFGSFVFKESVSNIDMSFFSIYLYFLSCTPLPPSSDFSRNLVPR